MATLGVFVILIEDIEGDSESENGEESKSSRRTCKYIRNLSQTALTLDNISFTSNRCLELRGHMTHVPQNSRPFPSCFEPH